MGSIKFCIVEALKALSRRPAATFFTVSSIGLSLFLAGVVWMAGRGVDQVSKGWARGVVVSVYLKDGVETAQRQRLERSMRALPGFHRLEHVGRQDALKRLEKNLGGEAGLLRDVDAGWLPESFEITLKGEREVLVNAQEKLVSMGRALPAVEEVRTLRRWQKRVDKLAVTLTTSASVLLFLTFVVCGFVVAATVRLGLLSRRKEIETRIMLGATKRFVAAPVLLEGAFQAFLGCMLALVLLFLLHSVTVPRIVEVFGAGWTEGLTGFLPLSAIVWAVCLAGLVGLFGSGLAVGRGGT